MLKGWLSYGRFKSGDACPKFHNDGEIIISFVLTAFFRLCKSFFNMRSTTSNSLEDQINY